MSTISSYNYLMPQSSSLGSGSLQSSNVMESLAEVLSNDASDTVGSSSSELDPVTLSQEAQNFMSGLSGANTNIESSDPLLALLTGSTGSATAGTGTDSNSNFTLTSGQQQQITNILEQYKNAPFTKATFDQIQNALQTAGLGPNQLSAQDQINSFNPTGDFLNDLNGNTANNAPDPANVAATEQTKSSNYINQIYQQWQSVSTTANSSSTAVTPITSTGNA